MSTNNTICRISPGIPSISCTILACFFCLFGSQNSIANISLGEYVEYEGLGVPQLTPDLNGDGIADYYYYDFSSRSFHFRAGDGITGFGEALQNIEVPEGGIIIQDLDADGDMDIVLAYRVDSKYPIRKYLNDGKAKFSSAGNVSTRVVSRPSKPDDYHLLNAVEDMDGDGDVDLVITFPRYDQTYWLENDGKLNFLEPVLLTTLEVNGQIQILDIDGDGIKDIFAVGAGERFNESFVIFGEERNRWRKKTKIHADFTPELFPMGGKVRQFFAETAALADFDGDGNLDIIVGEDYYGSMFYFRQEEPRSFVLTKMISLLDFQGHSRSRIHSLTTADLDLDGLPELFVGSISDNLRIFHNTRQGIFAKPSYQIADPGFFDRPKVHIQDVNSDELPDLIVNGTGGTRIWYNKLGYGTVSGAVVTEFTGDCSDEETSYPLAGQIIEFDPGGHLAMSNSRGEFVKYLLPGKYTVSVPDESSWGAACDVVEHEFDLVSKDASVGGIEFPRAPRVKVRDLAVSVLCTRLRPGLDAQYVINYSNNGTVPYSGVITFNYDERLQISSMSQEPLTQVDGAVQWEIRDLPYSAAGKIIVNVVVNRDVSVGDEICVSVEGEKDNVDEILLDHRDELCTPVTGSYDPNDIRVWPRGVGDAGRIDQDVSTLSYMVRFQNTGNDTAFTVVVRDTLPEELNVRRLRLGAASHTYSVNLLKNNILEFTFDDILLPDSTTDLLGSQGFVKFRIDLQESLPLGTQVRNRVGIYFDFNEVVMTNTALTTISSGLTSVDVNWGDESLNLYPNPTTEMLTISGLAFGTETVSIVDVHGRELKRLLVDGQPNISVNCQDLAPGSYFLQTRGVGLPRMARFVVVR